MMKRQVLKMNYKDRMERLMTLLVKRTLKVLNETPEEEFKLWTPVAKVINGTQDDYSILAFFPFWKGNDSEKVFHLRPAMQYPDGTTRMGMGCLLPAGSSPEDISTFFIRGLMLDFLDDRQFERELRMDDPEPAILDTPFHADFIPVHGYGQFGYDVEDDLAEHYGIDRHELYHLVEDIVRQTHQHQDFFDLADVMGMHNVSNITGCLSGNRTIGVRIIYRDMLYGNFCPFIRLEDGTYIQLECCFREVLPPETDRDFIVLLAHYYLFLMALADGLVEDAYSYYYFNEEELKKGTFSKSYKAK